jgi:hypothetical protein
VRLCFSGTAATNGPIVHPPDDTWVNMEQRWNYTDRGKPKNSEKKSLTSATLSTTNTNGLTWAQTRDVAVRRRRLTAWAMARPWNLPWWLGQHPQQTFPYPCDNWLATRTDNLVYSELGHGSSPPFLYSSRYKFIFLSHSTLSNFPVRTQSPNNLRNINHPRILNFYTCCTLQSALSQKEECPIFQCTRN